MGRKLQVLLGLILMAMLAVPFVVPAHDPFDGGHKIDDADH